MPGVAPEESGARLEMAVWLEVMGAMRICGATRVRRPQYLSLRPLKRYRICVSACFSTLGGKREVVVSDSTPPEVSPLSMPAMLSSNTPTK